MRSYQDVIVRPVISEKGDELRDEAGVYVFEVHPRANKVEIRKAVEAVFGVDVEKVRTVVIRGKIKRVGRTMGKRRNWKKAYVSLKEGSSIELFEGV